MELVPSFILPHIIHYCLLLLYKWGTCKVCLAGHMPASLPAFSAIAFACLAHPVFSIAPSASLAHAKVGVAVTAPPMACSTCSHCSPSHGQCQQQGQQCLTTYIPACLPSLLATATSAPSSPPLHCYSPDVGSKDFDSFVKMLGGGVIYIFLHP